MPHRNYKIDIEEIYRDETRQRFIRAERAMESARIMDRTR